MIQTPSKFRLSLAELAAGFRRRIELEVDGFKGTPEDAFKRRLDSQDFAFFCRTYLPHYIKLTPSRLHIYLHKLLPQAKGRGMREVVIAPRGEAKSTHISLAWLLWLVVLGRKRCIVLVSDTWDQGAAHLEAVKAELEANPRLANDYPEACGPGRLWREGLIITANDIKIQAAGSGKKLRGLRHGPDRPDLLVGDDLENDESVRTPAQRDKLFNWLMRAALKLGPADGSMDVVLAGTRLHYDSLLARLAKNPLWHAVTFKGLITYPDRMDLWDGWEEVLRNQGQDEAQAFYDDRREEMEAGAEVSWPAGRPLYKLMQERAQDRVSFDTEIQNDPASGEDAPFKELVYWVAENPQWVFYGAVDPSLGKNNRNRDPSAILVGGVDRSARMPTLDVVLADIRRRTPDRLIADVIAHHRRFMPLVWNVEAVAFQEFLRTELVARSAQEGVPVPARACTPHTDKTLRIEALQPHVVNGVIRFHSGQTTLIEQLTHFPHADHDDGPDALEMLWQAAFGGFTGRVEVQSISRPTHLTDFSW